MESNQDIQAEEVRRNFPSDWEVPEFRIDFWDGKTSDYCVIVPVINEGDRIRQFVRRLKENKIDAIADIIIVDGGSTDGSLNREYLRSGGVRGMLTKTDDGKLSAQLRVAYSFALCSEYLGVVTIDGNDKDDPAAIPRFLELLGEGYDFVQASRFILGGKKRNTPPSRHLAIRWIHAPLLGMASGFPWTDTTQGFRGYSRKLLLSQRLSIFRSVFSSYELLAYLSYASPITGFNCIESPSSRYYPKGEVPSKISSVNGNLTVLLTLVKACLGAYGPRPK
jgi:dolichol-phosphate mannosyltransferase